MIKLKVFALLIPAVVVSMFLHSVKENGLKNEPVLQPDQVKVIAEF